MVKTLSKCIREYKLTSILTPVFIIIEVILEVLIPYLMADLIDKGVDKGDMDYIWKMGLTLAIVAMISLAVSAIAGRFAAVASAGFAKNLRHDMFYRIQTFSFANIDKFSPASLVTRMTTDVTNVQNSYQMILRMAFRAPSMMIFAMIMSFRVNAQLSWIFVIFIPVIALALGFIINCAHPIFTRVFKKYDKLNNVVQENLHGIRVVKSFVREDHENEKFRAISGEIYKDFTKAEKIVNFNMPVMQLCVYACILLVSWFSARLIVYGDMTTGELASMMTYIMQILMSLMFISITMVMITLSKASGDRIAEVLNEVPDLDDPENPITEVKDGSIVFEGVSFSYAKDKDKLCLRNTDLNIRSGETVGIIGGTGSSKSTLVQLIPRLYDATEGRVLVGGIDVRNTSLKRCETTSPWCFRKTCCFRAPSKRTCAGAMRTHLTRSL